MTSTLDDAQPAGADWQPRRDGWLRRFLDAIARIFAPPPEPPPLPPPPEPGQLTQRREMKDPIALQAKGDAFAFQLRAFFLWHSEGLTWDELTYWTDRFYPRARGLLGPDATEAARQYEPHRARELEAELNATLGRRSWYMTEGNVTLRYQVQIRVEPDEAVREQLRGFWEQRIRMDCEHDLGVRRAELVDELTRRWSEILKRLHEDPLTPHAARLSEEQFATVFADFVAERKQGIEQVVELLREAVRQQDTLGLGPSEYTRAWDAALRSLLRQYGNK